MTLHPLLLPASVQEPDKEDADVNDIAAALPIPENILSHSWCRELVLEYVVALASQADTVYFSLTTTMGLCHLMDAPYSLETPMCEATSMAPLHLQAPQTVVEKLKRTVWLKIVHSQPQRMHRPQMCVKAVLPHHGLAVELHSPCFF